MTDTLAELLELDFEKSEATFKIPEGSRWTAGKYRIISEYQSPLAWLDKPETVEEVARAMHNSEYVCELSERDGFIQEGYIEQAQAAISTIKCLAGGDITAMQNQQPTRREADKGE